MRKNCNVNKKYLFQQGYDGDCAFIYIQMQATFHFFNFKKSDTFTFHINFSYATPHWNSGSKTTKIPRRE